MCFFLQFPFVPFVETLEKLQLFLYSEEDLAFARRSFQLVVVFLGRKKQPLLGINNTGYCRNIWSLLMAVFVINEVTKR